MIALAIDSHQLMQGRLLQEFFTGASALSRIASGGLIAAIWQGVLLAAVAALVLHLLPKTPPAIRFAVWFAVFALVTALPFLFFAPHAIVAAPANTHSPLLTLDARWTVAIAAIWAIASLVRAATLAAAALRVRALWKRATPIEAKIAIAGSRRAQICVSDDIDRPTVIGFFAPKILIPGWLLEKLTPAELEQVVLHEAGHLGRADDWMNLLQKIALVLFPLNPALAWVERRLCFERELACDERVLHALADQAGAAKQYASCLATLAEYRLERRSLVQGLALALGALGTSARESELGRRVGRILRPSAKMRPLHAKLVMGGAVLGLLVATTALERCPQLVAFATPGAVAGEVASVNAEQGATAVNATAEQGIRVQGTGLPSAALHNVSLRVDAGRTDAGRAQTWKTVGDAAPLIAAATPRNEQQTSALRATHVRATVPAVTRAAFHAVDTAARSTSTRQQSFAHSEPDGELIVTRWVVTTWQARDGARFIETSAQTTTALPGETHRPESSAPQVQTDFDQPPSQQPSPYAAVPVPGGWLVFQL